ncbi:hypothetical protein Vafri_14763 [Volvox africanus]|uniref:Uncharacterized protein n=1 Tax=Volvox africanus TaxID=51714 RepID=A0A8J4BFA9_9CHLO|nr:hypothetical protein Vafri_14763 [Volvox africanus]
MSFKLLLSFLFWCGMVELALGMQNPTHPGPFLSPQQQHARALQQLEQQQQLQYQQLQQQQAAVAAQRLATQSASSGHPIADLRSAQLPSGGTDVAAQLAAQMERLTNMMEARLGALESRFAAQVPAGSSGVDALLQPWQGLNAYGCPPTDPQVLLAVVQKVREEQASVTLVVPYWPAQPWWQQLMEMAVDLVFFPSSTALFVSVQPGLRAEFNLPWWQVVAVRVQW